MTKSEGYFGRFEEGKKEAAGRREPEPREEQLRTQLKTEKQLDLDGLESHSYRWLVQEMGWINGPQKIDRFALQRSSVSSGSPSNLPTHFCKCLSILARHTQPPFQSTPVHSSQRFDIHIGTLPKKRSPVPSHRE
ncbi:hypothetical protein ACLOJK_016276 [Asimina triloba]